MASTFVNNNGVVTVQRDVVSSTIKTATDLNILQVGGNGFLVEDVVVRTDSTGLAGGTALVLKADGIVFFQTAISGLGASALKDFKSASVTAIQASVPAGAKYITISSTIADCTGAGVATVTLIGRRLDSTSTIDAI